MVLFKNVFNFIGIVLLLSLAISDAKNAKKKSKSAIKTPDRHWPFGIIPVQIDNTYPSPRTKEIQRCAMKKIQEKTCIKFYEFPQNFNIYLWNKPYLILKNAGGSCYSTNFTFHPQVGMDRSYRYQWLTAADFSELEHYFCDYPDILHQLGHVIGLTNEQKHPNRNKCVKIDWEKLKQSNRTKEEIAFDFDLDKPEETTNFGLPYDFESIMHLGSDYYGLKEVMTPKTLEELARDCEYVGNPEKMGYWDRNNRGTTDEERDAIRKSVDLSEVDIQKVNRMYDLECKRRDNIWEYNKFLFQLSLNGAREVNPPSSQCFE